MSARAAGREVKRHECRAPDAEFVGTVSQGSPESFRGNRWADGFESRWDLWTERQPQRGDIFVESAMKMKLSSVRSGICRPDGAGEFGGVGGYKDFAPDGTFGRSATVSAEPIAAREWQ